MPEAPPDCHPSPVCKLIFYEVYTSPQLMEFLVLWFYTDLKFDEHSLMLFASPDSF
jgi:hypothetical protein